MEQFTAAELKALKRLDSPEKIQNFLNKLPYHLASTVYSPRKVLREKTAHCFEGALFAAAALRVHGHEPLIMDLESDETDTDHVIALYRQNGAWGAIATSNYPGCRGRPAIYKNFRELALSYFNDYFSPRRRLTLRKFSNPVNLKRFDKQNWMTSEKSLWFIEEYLFEIPHKDLVSKAMVRSLPKIDERAFLAGTYGKLKKKT
jgi:hypothetical protein